MATCERHPDRDARWVCSVCGRGVCARCGIWCEHPPLCSEACDREATAGQGERLEAAPAQQPAPAGPPTATTAAAASSPGRRSSTLLTLLTLQLLVSVALLAALFTGLWQLRELWQLQLRPEPRPVSADGVPGPPPIPRVFEPPRLELRQDQTLGASIEVEGLAPYGELVALENDARVVATTLVAAGRFRFEDVALEPGAHVLRVIAWSREGPAIASLPVSISRGTRPRRGSNLLRGETGDNQLALTFDGGSTAADAQTILDTLASRRVRSTIFLTGRFIQLYPELTRRIVADGHEVGNHTWDHPHLADWSDSRGFVTKGHVDEGFLLSQLQRTARIFERTTGRQMEPMWRAPYGEVNDQILRWAAAGGWRHIGWTRGLDSLDWVADVDSRLYRTPEQIRDHILRRARSGRADGGIVLMHLGVDRPHETKPSRLLGELIDELRASGYALVPVSSLLRPRGS